MISLPPVEFTFGKYGVDVPFNIYMNGLAKWLLSQNIIGYCNGMELFVRPVGNMMAAMIEIDGWTGWMHIPIEVWEDYLDLRNRM